MSKKVSVADQRRLTEQLHQFTQATPTDAARLLKAAKWNLNLAVDNFYDDYQAQENAARASSSSSSGGEKKAKEGREKKLKIVFDDYKGEDADITIEEIGPYFEDIGIVDMDSDVGVYLVSYELGSKAMGRLGEKEFVEAWGKLKIDTLEGMAAQVPKWRTQFLTEPEYFRKVYKYVYDLGRLEGAKVVDRATALAFWQTLLPPVFASSPSALASQAADGQPTMGLKEFGWWCEFLEGKGVKGVSKDVWTLFVEYAVKIPATYEVYDDEDSWPSVLDEFTEFARARIGQEQAMEL